jgi:hypothetical protein
MIEWVMKTSRLDSLIDVGRVNQMIEKMRYRDSSILQAAEGHQFIADRIGNGKPLAIAKMGDVELQALSWHLSLPQFYKYTWVPPTFGDLTLDTNAGVFPRSGAIAHQFCEFYLERLKELDVCGVWFNPSEAVVAKRYCPRAQYVGLQVLEPYFNPTKPWSATFEGKRILVIHSSCDTIRSQYERREMVWRKYPGMLPEFELLTLKVPYFYGNQEHSDWFSLFGSLEDQVSAIAEKQGFDIALIGCGAGSLPMAIHVKRLGKIGIHLGGTTQVLFGVRGKRWDRMPFFQNLYNDAWCRPDSSEIPSGADKLDAGGYW